MSSKKFLVGLFTSVVVALVAAVVLPFLIDLSRFKPYIQNWTRQAIAGELDFSSLRLTIFPHVGFRLHNVTLSNSTLAFANTRALKVEAIDLRVDLKPLFQKRFRGYLAISKPEIQIVQNAAGSNVEAFIRPETNQTEMAAQITDPSTDPEFLDFKDRIEIVGLVLADAKIVYFDNSGPEETSFEIDKFTLEVKNIALNQPIDIAIAAAMSWPASEPQITGEIEGTALAVVQADDTNVEATLAAEFDFAALDIRLPTLVDKPKGKRLNISLDAIYSSRITPNVQVNSLSFSAENLRFPTLLIENLDAKASSVYPGHAFELTTTFNIAYTNTGLSLNGPLALHVAGPLEFDGTDFLYGNLAVVATSTGLNIVYDDGTARLAGPIAADFQATAELSRQSLQRASGNLDLNLTDVQIDIEDSLNKNPGLHTTIHVAANTSGKRIEFENLELRVGTAKVSARGSIPDMDTMQGNFSVQSEIDNLRDLAAILPVYNDILYDGHLHLMANFSGRIDDLAQIKSEVDADANLAGSDLKLKLHIADALQPHAEFILKSKHLDLDRLLAPFSQDTEAKATTETEFQLTDVEKSSLGTANLRGKIVATNVLYDGQKLSNVQAEFKLVDLVAELHSLELDVFGGLLQSKVAVDMKKFPIAWTGNFGLKNIATEQFIALFYPEHRQLLSALANFNLELNGIGTLPETIKRHISGQGGFAVAEGQFNSFSMAAEIEQEVDAFMPNLSIVDAAADSWARAEKLLANPLLKQAGGPQLDLSAYKSGYERFKEFSIAGLLSTDRSIGGTNGRIGLNKGKLNLDANNASKSGVYLTKVDVDLDGRLSGTANYTASALTRDKMLTRSSYSSLLFDENNDFSVGLTLAGTLAAPKFKIDFSPIRKGFKAKAQKLVKREVEDHIQALIDNIVSGQKEALKLEAERLKKLADQQKQRAADAAKKAAADAKKLAEAEAKKAKDEAQKIGDRLFGR